MALGQRFGKIRKNTISLIHFWTIEDPSCLPVPFCEALAQSYLSSGTSGVAVFLNTFGMR